MRKYTLAGHEELQGTQVATDDDDDTVHVHLLLLRLLLL